MRTPGNREAAKYRVRARAAEIERDALRAERDTLAARLTRFEALEAERIATAPVANRNRKDHTHA
ncbi:hypothetical protein GCM10009854_27880 [Saccharopolyspora halophila]|uniref:Uncharacterized protein n=1 Tax=Saccharopolyspora halophila TaxID=405551 RepID=A0ABN3GCV3_9PSEU